jgi:hypothetical protein
MKKTIAKPVLTPDGGGFLVTCFVLQGLSLFKSETAVSKDGTVSIKNDERVYDGLPVRPPRLR